MILLEEDRVRSCVVVDRYHRYQDNYLGNLARISTRSTGDCPPPFLKDTGKLLKNLLKAQFSEADSEDK